MSSDYERPDPDHLLTQVKDEESRQAQGRLKIFLGYAAGVGKTYAMLEAAQERHAEGFDIVVGYVETHGRAETDALLSGLEVIPRQSIDYRGVQLSEMDIDAVLHRRPQLVLVDELAHTNAPGSRHAKRYQDVEELLNSGIDVYTTLNIQHVESLNDVVAQITEIVVRETVPDRILDRADQIVLVDLPPEELLQRLGEGKVYVPDQASRALQKFFRLGNLTALREISLRRTARRVDDQMNAYMQTRSIVGPWAAGERLLICVSPSPLSEKLIRSGCRMAQELDAEWLAVHIEADGQLNEAARNQLARNLRLAEELGAQVISLPGSDLAATLTQYARLHNVTKIIVGKSLKPRWKELLQGSFVDQLIHQSGNIDVYVISSAEDSGFHPEGFFTTRPIPIHWFPALVAVALITLLGFSIEPFISPTNLVMFYLLGVVIVAVRYGRAAATLTVVLSIVAFNFSFVPPRFTFEVENAQYFLTFFVLLVVGLIIAHLAARVRENAESAKRRELHTSALYGLTRDLSLVNDLPTALAIIVNHISHTFQCEAGILLPQGSNLILQQATAAFQMERSEYVVAHWVMEHQQTAGWGTDTLPSAKGRYLPLKTGQDAVGVLGVYPGATDGKEMPLEQIHLLEAFASQIALRIDAFRLAEKARLAQLLQETDRLHSALLNSISHDLKTPLVSISGALSSLRDQAAYLDEASRKELIDGAWEEANRLHRLLVNLLDMTRLEADALPLKKMPCDLQEIVGVAIQQMKHILADRDIVVNMPPDLPMVEADFVLIVQVLTNLLDNAAKYSPANSPIEVAVGQDNEHLVIHVVDYGIGIPEPAVDRVFDKFYRAENTGRIGGSGLGLSICRGIIDAHNGSIQVNSRPEGGTDIAFTLPIAVVAEAMREQI